MGYKNKKITFWRLQKHSYKNKKTLDVNTFRFTFRKKLKVNSKKCQNFAYVGAKSKFFLDIVKSLYCSKIVGYKDVFL